jgi:hypothetical protein
LDAIYKDGFIIMHNKPPPKAALEAQLKNISLPFLFSYSTIK